MPASSLSLKGADQNVILLNLFRTPESLQEIPQLLNYTDQYKDHLNKQLIKKINDYQSPENLKDDIIQLHSKLKETKQKASKTQEIIVSMTKSIQDLDQYKRNLVLSMKILKRLQMLVISFNNLTPIIQSHEYKTILTHFGVVKELLEFFKPYKSIDEINQLNISINKTQNKLIDDIFIDFEDSFTNNFTNDQLIYGCEILELVDVKYKDKLLNWFYNYQLKEIKSIFNNLDEAGSLENLNRRYIYFNNVLKNLQQNYLNVFPKSWLIDVELAKIFCKITKQDLGNQLSSNSKIDSNILLDSLFKTLEFEKSLNENFKTDDFDKIISSQFEPYLMIWVSEQDKFLNSKFLEFFQTPKVPQEFVTTSTSIDEFLTILKINNIPNISNSSIEMFKLFNKILTQIIKLTNGEILVDVSNLFIKYLHEYYAKHLLPIINQSVNTSFASSSNPENIESIKYLTMVLNTADYVISNINDLQSKFLNLIDEQFKSKISFDVCLDWYFELINKSIANLINNINNSLQFSWRQFENNNWNNMDSIADVSNYLIDLKNSINDNVKIILPLIIRDGYIRNFCDKLTEAIINTFMNHLKSVIPLSILNIEQILLDATNLKNYFLTLPLYSNPNFDETKNKGADNEKSDDRANVSKLYVKLVNTQFHKLETLLKVLLTPTLPIDNLIEIYFQLIGDKSVNNFRKILNLKDIPKSQQQKYIDHFNLQLSMSNDLLDESPILHNLEDNEVQSHIDLVHPQSQPAPHQPDIKDLFLSKSPEPGLPDFLKSKSPKILANNSLKMNNIEKNLREFAINGESHVTKFNENFKNFGKFFRKDNND